MEKVTRKTPGKISGSHARSMQQSNQLYQDASCRFLAMQAGLLAAELQEGKPCPVCGSLEHPAPCRLETEPIREEQVEALRAGRDDADQKQRTAAEACQEAQISLEHESRRRIEIQGKLDGQNQDSPAAQSDVDALEGLRRMATEIRRCGERNHLYLSGLPPVKRSGRNGRRTEPDRRSWKLRWSLKEVRCSRRRSRARRDVMSWRNSRSGWSGRTGGHSEWAGSAAGAETQGR